jgi:hypothetical protein
MEWKCSGASSTQSLNNESREKLVWGKELYVDSTQVNANADLDSLTPRFAVEAREAMQAHLATLFSEEDVQHEQEASGDSADTLCVEATSTEAIACPVPTPLPVTLSEPEQEELAQENAARHDWITEQGRPQREVRGYYQRTSELRISTTDPDATPMRLKSGGTHLGYHVHYVVDGGKARVILQVLVTPSEVMDNQPMRDLIFRTRFRWKLQPHHMTGDTKYGTIQNIRTLEDAGICDYVPIPDWEHKTPLYGPSKFTYDAAHDLYVCPQGQLLRRSRTEYQAEKVEYRAEAATCNACPLKAQCTESQQGRQLHRSFHATSNGCRATTRPRPIRRPCASGKSGSNPYSLRPKIGMVCAASACGCSGASIAKPCGSLLAKISNDCSRSVAGDAARSQRRRYVSLFGVFCVRCVSSFWSSGLFWY